MSTKTRKQRSRMASKGKCLVCKKSIYRGGIHYSGRHFHRACNRKLYAP